MMALNSPRAQAERARAIMISQSANIASAEFGITLRSMAPNTVAAASAITVVIVGGPAVWTIAMAGIAVGALINDIDSMHATASQLEAAVDLANQTYMQNPVRSAFLDTIANANASLAQACALIQQELNALRDEYEALKHALFQQCLIDLELEP